jgi:hypothetical protein
MVLAAINGKTFVCLVDSAGTASVMLSHNTAAVCDIYSMPKAEKWTTTDSQGTIVLQGYHCSFQIPPLPPIPTKAYVVIPNAFYQDHDDAWTSEIFTNAGYAVTLLDDRLEFEFVGVGKV